MLAGFLGIGLLLASALSTPVAARDKAYRKLLHRAADYHVLVVKGQHPEVALARLQARPQDYRIVVWQSPPEVSTPDKLKSVLTWVDQGGSLWFQDSRLAQTLGLQPAPVHKGDLRQVKLHKAAYGDIRKQPGAATLTTVPIGPHHVIVTRVSTVGVFLPQVGADEFSAVASQPDLASLLVLETDRNKPLGNRVIAGLLRRGQGNIVFKPLIFDEHLSGERFQGNLLEFCAGYGVPQAAPGSAVPTAGASSPARP